MKNMDIVFYQSRDDEKPFEKFFSELSDKMLAKVLRQIELLADQGIEVKEPHAKHVEGPIWELRVKYSTNICRILYAVCGHNEIVLLHGFVKKTNKIPKRELDIARKRLNAYQ